MKIVLHNFPVDGALLMYLASHMNIIRIQNILHHLVFIHASSETYSFSAKYSMLYKSR